ncbi:mitochondrion protein [Moniliophthora roreri]|nr:mitochondrion protein [Moniliophthora roreri]
MHDTVILEIERNSVSDGRVQAVLTHIFYPELSCRQLQALSPADFRSINMRPSSSDSLLRSTLSVVSIAEVILNNGMDPRKKMPHTVLFLQAGPDQSIQRNSSPMSSSGSAEVSDDRWALTEARLLSAGLSKSFSPAMTRPHFIIGAQKNTVFGPTSNQHQIRPVY